MSGKVSFVIVHDNSEKVNNILVALLVSKWAAKMSHVFLANCGNIEADTIYIRNAKFWHFVCPILNGKYHFSSSSDVQMIGQTVSSEFGQFILIIKTIYQAKI